MKRVSNYIFPALVIAVLLIYGCYNTNRVSVQNLADLYHSDYHYLHPEFAVYHSGDSSSLLYFKLDESELLYVRRNQEDSFSSKARIFCKVTSAYESSVLMDSNSVTLRFSSISNNKTGFAYGSIPIKLKAGNVYLLTIITTDLISRKTDVKYLNADKTNLFNKQNFLVKDASSGQVFLPDYTDTETAVTISYNHPSQKLYVNYYNRDFPLAPPPFLQVDSKPFKFKGDSSFILNPDANGIYHITMPAKGFYHMQADTASHEGLTLYRFEKHFPVLGEAHQLVPSLRYITSTEEYTRFTNPANVKQEIDDFWLNIASGSQDRARTLIRSYYGRVQDANHFFTTYLEGWKSDRGMIYIIFGPPNIVYRTSTSETWTYGEDRNFMSLSFTFEKVNNPFSDNDFALDRSAQFRNVWYNSVDIWRQGRVY